VETVQSTLKIDLGRRRYGLEIARAYELQNKPTEVTEMPKPKE
jgi:hypothetical protein